jgi:pSer/pThr/pTyr-binding forkhead associated (FHA) protein
MTLSDLGSSSGTIIKDVPCLPGEIMVVEAGDEIFLGDIRIRFSIIEKQAGLS